MAVGKPALKTTKSPRPKGDFMEYLGNYEDGFGDDNASAPDSPYINVLLGGAQNAGKTRFSFTAPGVDEERGFLVLDFDEGLRTAYSMGYNPWRFKITEEDSGAFVKTRNLVDAIAKQEEPFDKLQTVVLDAYTGQSQTYMNSMLRKMGRDPVGSGQKAEYDQWAAVRNQLRLITNRLKAAPVNFIAIAHTDFREDKKGDLIPTYDVDGSFRKDLPKLFDEVYYMEPVVVGQTTEYRTWIKQHPKGWPTKSRTFLEQDWLPKKQAYVVNATWDYLFGELWVDALKKRKGHETD